MQISSIGTENLAFFDQLIPENLSCDLLLEHRFALGAIDDERGAVGALVFDVLSGSTGVENATVVKLQWLYVAPEHRTEGAADALMKEFLAVVDGSGLIHVLCDVPFSDEYDLLCNYLEAWGFEFHAQDSYELSVPIGEFLDCPHLKKRPTAKTVPLSRVSDEDFSLFMQMAQTLPSVQMGLSSQRQDYDCELSCLYMPDGLPMGGMLLRRFDSGDLELQLLRPLDNQPEGLHDMLMYGVQAARLHCNPENNVHISCRADFSGGLLDWLLPGRQPDIIRRGYLGIDLMEQE